MAISTEATVRTVLINAIRGQAENIGWDDTANGNVHDHLLEWRHDEGKGEYLMAMVGGDLTVLAVGVQVRGNDDWFAAGNITKRTYEIEISIYAAMGVDGEGVNRVFDVARHIRNGIRLLGQRLSETVDFVSATGQVEPKLIADLDPVGPIIEGPMRYVAERKNPDF